MRYATLVLVLALSCGHSAAAQTTAPISAQSKFATVFGAKIHYLEAGAGPTVILIHGLADDTEVWKETVAPLAVQNRVIVIDQIGFGRSDKPLLGYRTSTFVDYFAGFMDELKIPKATLVGNSLGGWVAAAYAVQHPQRVEKLVLVCAAGYADVVKLLPMPIDALRFSSREAMRPLLQAAFHDQKLAGDETINFLMAQRVSNGDGHTIGQFVDSMKRGEDFLDGRLARLQIPTLIIWGRSDRLTPLQLGQRFQREIKSSKLEVIEQCGHMPQQECPAPFNTLLTRFIAAR
ncbi:MAG: alpha/beta hydrolase [Acidobacteriales bacterium]|nr:alpha/beta hydrolase [Terriglobales bacterium]